jgi:hypothetical protein
LETGNIHIHISVTHPVDVLQNTKTPFTINTHKHATLTPNFSKDDIKLVVGLINYAPRHENVWGSGGTAPSFLTSALDGGAWSANRFTSEERVFDAYCIGDLLSSRTGLDVMGDRISLTTTRN